MHSNSVYSSHRTFIVVIFITIFLWVIPALLTLVYVGTILIDLVVRDLEQWVIDFKNFLEDPIFLGIPLIVFMPIIAATGLTLVLRLQNLSYQLGLEKQRLR